MFVLSNTHTHINTHTKKISIFLKKMAKQPPNYLDVVDLQKITPVVNQFNANNSGTFIYNIYDTVCGKSEIDGAFYICHVKINLEKIMSELHIKLYVHTKNILHDIKIRLQSDIQNKRFYGNVYVMFNDQQFHADFQHTHPHQNSNTSGNDHVLSKWDTFCSQQLLDNPCSLRDITGDILHLLVSSEYKWLCDMMVSANAFYEPEHVWQLCHDIVGAIHNNIPCFLCKNYNENVKYSLQ